MDCQKENCKTADQADGRRKPRRDGTLTRKAAEAADKADVRKRRQREQATTRKTVETADQADAHRMRKKESVAKHRVSIYKASERMLPSILLLLKQRRA